MAVSAQHKANWMKAKTSPATFKNYSVPVATKSRLTPLGGYSSPDKMPPKMSK